MTRQANSWTGRGTAVPRANRIWEPTNACATPAKAHSISARLTTRRTTVTTRSRTVARGNITGTAVGRCMGFMLARALIGYEQAAGLDVSRRLHRLSGSDCRGAGQGLARAEVGGLR